MLPAFGLMLVGFAAALANGALFLQFAKNPDGGKEWLKGQLPGIRQMGFAHPQEAGDAEDQEEKAAAELAPKLFWVWPVATIAGGITFASGLSMLQRKRYRLAQLGCVLAAVNLPHLCCVPGAIFGLWGLLLLMSEEGREHFAK